MQINPVFVMGMPRSGTTMLASQVAAHSDAIALPEMPFIDILIDSTASSDNETKQLYGELQKHFYYRASGMSVPYDVFSKPFLEQEAVHQRIYNLLLHHFGSHRFQDSAVTWIEHTPYNLERVDQYRSVFPGARFIHIVRDPRGVYSSMRGLWRWNTHNPIRFSRKWNDLIAISADACDRHKDVCLEIRYEDYLENHRSKLIEICDFLGLDFEDAMLVGGGIELPEYTLMQHKMVGRPVQKSNSNAWQEKLPEREAEIVGAECLKWMQHYEYCEDEYSPHPPDKIETVKFKIKQRLLSPISKLKRLKDNLKT